MAILQPMLQRVQEKGVVKWLMVTAPVLGALVTVFNFTKIYDGLGLPRPVFTTEYAANRDDDRQQITQTKEALRNLEIEFRTRSIKSDLRAIRDLDKEITGLTSKSIPVPDSILDFKASLEESVVENRNKLKDLEKMPTP